MRSRAKGEGHRSASREPLAFARRRLVMARRPLWYILLTVDDSQRQRARTARADIVSGALRGAALATLIQSIPSFERDGFVDAILGIEDAPPDIPDLPRGAVPYLPSGVAEILAVVLEVPLRLDDDIVDLGSGLGRVVLLAHLLSGARARGLEIQEPFVLRARASAAELGLTSVSFVHANVAETELDGSVFFLYAPFNGEMLTRVLGRLEDVARRRPIVVCAVDLELRDVPWLLPRKTSSVSLGVYESIMPGVKRR
jgi:hypothetical protein